MPTLHKKSIDSNEEPNKKVVKGDDFIF